LLLTPEDTAELFSLVLQLKLTEQESLRPPWRIDSEVCLLSGGGWYQTVFF